MHRDWAPAFGVSAVMLPELEFPDQIALCVELGVTRYSYRPREVSDSVRQQSFSNWGRHAFDLTPARFLREGAALTRRLHDAGMEPDYSLPSSAEVADAGSDSFEMHLEAAAQAGCEGMRVSISAGPSGQDDLERKPELFLARARGELAKQIDKAQRFGLKLVIEMHAGTPAIDAAWARQLVHPYDPKTVGLIFDLPNFAREGVRDAAWTAKQCGPYLDHLHVGGARVTPGGVDASGFRQAGTEFCRLVESDLHAPAWIEAALSENPSATLVMEDFTAGLPGADRLRDTVAGSRLAVDMALAQRGGKALL